MLLFGLAGQTSAQVIGSNDKLIEVFQVDSAPVLDGVLDDDAWAFAAVIEDLHEVDPDEYEPPSEASAIYVVYTESALYIGARFWDKEPDGIKAQVLRQGDFSFGEDSISVYLDPFNQGRSGYIFDLNPNGSRNQAVFANVTDENWSWNGIWHGEARIDEHGWVAEIEIPFKTLSFDPRNETWGLNIARYIGRKWEQIGWVSANRTQNPAVSGQMGGMRGLEQGLGLDVVPSIRAGESRNYLLDSQDSIAEPSLDVFYKVTPAMTAALTINTDFSGTGADARQINLTRFGLFFPEQRGFFLQDADIFEFGRITDGDYNSNSTISSVERQSGRPFFSRRIGLSDGGETIDINVGGKLTGRAGRWDIGMLAIRQDEFAGLDASDLFVGRFAANVLEESSVGMIVTHGDPNSDFDNTVAGVDFRYLNTRLDGGKTLQGSLWYQQSETVGLEGNDAAYGFSLEAPNSSGFRGLLAYKELQENFYPALGFVNRVDVRDLSGELGYTWYLESDLIRNYYAGIDYQRIETLDGELQSQVVALRPLEIYSDARDYFALQYFINEERLVEPFEISDGVIIPVGNYSFDQYCANFATADSRALSVEVYYCGGEFFDGTQDSGGTRLVWRPSKHFRFATRFDINDIHLPGGDFITRLASLRADIAFTSQWYWENFLQYDNVSNSMGLNSILRWVPRAGREMVLVVNREYVDLTQNRDFRTVSGDVTFKFSYTFRF